MPSTAANGITIEYDTIGEPSADPMLLVMGLGAQMISWPQGFCDALAARGFHVIRFDNRDVGLSSKIEDGPRPDVMAAFTGDVSSASYTLSDMAADATGLLDVLGIGAAHVVGASMGGMIAQTIAIEHPSRVRSLCSIMSTTGADEVTPTEGAMTVLLRPPATERDQAIANSVEASKVIGSTGFDVPEELLRSRAAAAYDRCFYPIGIARQLVAVRASGDRTAALAGLDVPTVVVHGSVDPLVPPLGGELTAKAIPGAELVVVEGMGHDLPEGAWPVVVDAIARNAAKASKAS
jgi:pimeloyl-ACP methyl ester carboxylesterase